MTNTMSLRVTISYFLLLVFFLFSVSTVANAGLLDQIKDTAGETLQNAGVAPASEQAAKTPTQVVGLIIKTMLALVSVIFVVLTIYAGFTWMTARGNDEKMQAAVGTLEHAIIGLVITMSAYVLAYFIFNIVLESVGFDSILTQ